MPGYKGLLFIYIFFHTFFFQLLDGQAVVTGVVHSPPPGSCLHFLSRIEFSNPTARRCFIECWAIYPFNVTAGCFSITLSIMYVGFSVVRVFYQSTKLKRSNKIDLPSAHTWYEHTR